MVPRVRCGNFSRSKAKIKYNAFQLKKVSQMPRAVTQGRSTPVATPYRTWTRLADRAIRAAAHYAPYLVPPAKKKLKVKLTLRPKVRSKALVHAGKATRTAKHKCSSSQMKLKVNKKFAAKVNKVITHSKVFGRHSYITSLQLRQVNFDEYHYKDDDTNGHPLDFFTPLRLLDSASFLWNVKSRNSDFYITAGNFNDNTKLHVIDSYATFFFKSCSQHVVNIELYECTSKTTQDERPRELIIQSGTTFTADYSNPAGTFPMADVYLGTGPSHWVELYKHFNVKVTKMKFLPGESQSYFIQGPKNKIIDLTQFTSDGVLNRFAKGISKAVYFRVINDPTISSGLENNYVHNYPSTSAGGVAVRYTAVTKLNPPPSDMRVSGSQVTQTNTFRDCFWTQFPTGNDQQVTYQNPQAVVSGGL